jgi:hypothetical protein
MKIFVFGYVACFESYCAKSLRRHVRWFDSSQAYQEKMAVYSQKQNKSIEKREGGNPLFSRFVTNFPILF